MVYIFNGILPSSLSVCLYIYMYVCMYVYNEISLFAVNLKGIMLSEINQAKKDKYCMISLICGI